MMSEIDVNQSNNNDGTDTRDTEHSQAFSQENHAPPGHRRTISGSILSKLSFLRTATEENLSSSSKTSLNNEYTIGDDKDKLSQRKPSRAMAVAVQQQKTRRRKGSLRKAALLGRGAQREKRELKSQLLDMEHEAGYTADGALSPTSSDESSRFGSFGLGISDLTPRPSMDGFSAATPSSLLPNIRTLPMGQDDHLVTSPSVITSPTLTYTSTTDEEDVLSIPSHALPPPRDHPLSSGSDGYFADPPILPRRRSTLKKNSSTSNNNNNNNSKAPLATLLPTSPLPPPNSLDHDYAETEWWGWVILLVTWLVFVTGMGSCLGIWSWAWDVGETPYAPPEFQDDPTLPIVGYYPALIILTTVMAWVWVVIAWVGMKYFRHAKISSD